MPNSNPAPGITWTVSGPGCAGADCGTITGTDPEATATYRAPAVAPSPNSVTITATPVADPSRAASVAVIVSDSVTITVLPPATTVALGATTDFIASITGMTDDTVNWDVDGIAGGNATVGTVLSVASYPN